MPKTAGKAATKDENKTYNKTEWSEEELDEKKRHREKMKELLAIRLNTNAIALIESSSLSEEDKKIVLEAINA